MSETIQITLPWPHKALSPNGRPHFMARARAVKKARTDGNLAAIAAMRKSKWRTVNRAETRITFKNPVARKRDGDNHLAMLKPFFDGMADAGLIANDVGFTHHPVQFVKAPFACVVVDIRAF